MGDGGGLLSFAGAILSLIPGPWQIIGVAMMIGGGMWSAYEQRKAAREAMEKAARDRWGMKTNTRTSQRSIPVVYGQTRVGGNILYSHTGGARDSDGVQRNRNLHMIIGISEGPIEDFLGVWLNDLKVWEKSPGMVYINSGFLDTPLKPYIDLDFRMGCNSQSIFDQIRTISTDWGWDTKGNWVQQVDLDFNDRYPLTAMAWVKLTYPEPDYNDQKWSPPWQGVPTVTFEVKGRRIRSLTDINTLAWSDNPATILFDVLTDKRYGWGVPSSKIDIVSFQGVSSFAAGSGSGMSGDVSEPVSLAAVSPYGYFEAFTRAATDVSSSPVITFGANYYWATLGISSVSRLPISAGSFGFTTAFSGQTWTYKDNSTGGINCVSGNTSDSKPFLAGSIDYTTGSVFIATSNELIVGITSPSFLNRNLESTWYANWGGSFSTTKPWLASSPTMVISGSNEVLTETASGSGIFLSNSGGWAKVDYDGGYFLFAFNSAPTGSAWVTYRSELHMGYQFNGVLLDARPAVDVVRELCSHFRGYLTYTQGVYQLNVDKAGSPIYYFDDDNIKAGTFVINQTPISERPNRIRIKYNDRSENYSPMDVIYEPTSPVLSLDIAVNEHTLNLPGLVYKDQAYRMAQTLGKQSMLGNTCEFETGQDGFVVEPGDLIAVTHPSAAWVDKPFRVVQTEEKSEETVKLSCIEHDNAVYVDEYTG